MKESININTLLAILALVTAIGGGFYFSGDLKATSDVHDRKIQQLQEQLAGVDTTEIEKNLSVLLSKVEQYGSAQAQVRDVHDSVIKLKADFENLSKRINGIPTEFPTLKAKVDQLMIEFDKLESKANQ